MTKRFKPQHKMKESALLVIVLVVCHGESLPPAPQALLTPSKATEAR